MFANRNGFFYTIDRVTGKLIVAKPFVETTWAKEISSVTGRPILLPNNHPTEQGVSTCPDLGGGTNFMSPSYDPASRLFFVTARETCAVYFGFDQEFKVGVHFEAGGTVRPRDQKNWARFARSIRSRRERKWEFRYPTTSASGVLSTASGLVFAGDGDGNLLAFESKTGKNLWHYQLGSALRSTSGTTYMLDGRQYLLVPSGARSPRSRCPSASHGGSKDRGTAGLNTGHCGSKDPPYGCTCFTPAAVVETSVKTRVERSRSSLATSRPARCFAAPCTCLSARG